MKTLMIAATCIAALAGCTAKEDRITFDGFYFPAKARHTADDRSYFEVQVSRPEQSAEGAVAAGVYQATRYCVQNYGTSRIAWDVGPDADVQAQTDARGDLLLSGRCLA